MWRVAEQSDLDRKLDAGEQAAADLFDLLEGAAGNLYTGEPGDTYIPGFELEAEEVEAKLRQMPVGQLRALLVEARVDASDCVEKEELVQKNLEIMMFAG
eukprot:COSAG06_NODE_8290_length_2213_cov_27.560549_2_plen_100_part_00